MIDRAEHLIAAGQRAALTTIYFLLPGGGREPWHRVQSDEAWHFYEAAVLDLWMASPDGGQASQHRQAARSTGAYTVVGCTVGPGFDFRDFALAGDQLAAAAALRTHHPRLAELL